MFVVGEREGWGGGVCISANYNAFMPASVAQSDARPAGHQEVAGSIPAVPRNIL